MPAGSAALLQALNAFDWEAWNTRLREGLTDPYTDTVRKAGEAVFDAFTVDDAFTSLFMSRYLGERIVQLDAFTKESVTALIARVFEQQTAGSPGELGRLIRDEVRQHVKGFETWRANRIARTETGYAYNHGTTLAWKQSGGATMNVTDGDRDEPCASANGAVWTIEQCLDNALGHPNAVMDGTRVRPLGLTAAAYRARWSGRVVRLVTAGGVRTTVGPNHPVLTDRGWLPAQALRCGDCVVTDGAEVQWDAAARPHFDERPPQIAEVFEAMRAHGSHARVVATAGDFHGDGNFCEGDVEIVRTHCALGIDAFTVALEMREQLPFHVAGAQAQPLSGGGPRRLHTNGIDRATPSAVSGGDPGRVVGRRSDGDATFSESIPDDAVADAEFVRDLGRRLSRAVALDHLIDVDHDTFVGHAFDLTTASGTYFADGLLTHNCTRAFSPHE